MSAWSKLWAKLTRSKKYREAFVVSQLKRGIPTQIRVLRKQRNWTQADLAEHSGLTQGAISRAEDPDYGNLTFNTVLTVAAGFDVAFVGRFIPFSELTRWHDNLSEEALQVPSFKEDSFGEETEHEMPKALVLVRSSTHAYALPPENNLSVGENQKVVTAEAGTLSIPLKFRQEELSFSSGGNTNNAGLMADHVSDKTDISQTLVSGVEEEPCFSLAA